MEGKHILIVGAGGYLGAHLSLFMANSGVKVTALCHSQKEDDTVWRAAMYRIIYGDITQSPILDEICKYDYDYVVYLISLNHFDSEGEIATVCNTNILPLWNLENRLQNRIEKFIYFSTQQVYGRIEAVNVDEHTSPAPVNNYGLTHMLCENVTDFFNRKSSTRFINIRLSNGYGEPVFRENNCWWLVINDLCKTAVEEQVIRLQSDGSPLRDFIYISDICRAVRFILEKSENENVYNISSGITYTIGEIARTVQKIYKQTYGKEIPILLPPGKQLQTNAPSRYTIDNHRLQTLGFSPQINLETGIQHIFKYLKA